MYCCSFNCRTIGGDMDHLAKIMDKFHIVCLQSTHMVAANMRFQNMTLSCNKYVGFLYRNDTNPQLSLMERCASIITNKYTIISAYCPFGDDEGNDEKFWNDLQLLVPHDSSNVIIGGDFNAHMTLTLARTVGHVIQTDDENLYPTQSDTHAVDLSNFALRNSLSIQNFSTRVSFFHRITCKSIMAANGGTIIDYCLSGSNVIVQGIRTQKPRFSSDHCALCFKISQRKQHRNRPFSNVATIVYTTSDMDLRYNQLTQFLPLCLKSTIPRRSWSLSPITKFWVDKFHRLSIVHRNSIACQQARRAAQQHRRLDYHNHLVAFIRKINDLSLKNETHVVYKALQPWIRRRSSTLKSDTELRKATESYKKLLRRNIMADDIPDIPQQNRNTGPVTTSHIDVYTDGSWDQHQKMGWAAFWSDDSGYDVCIFGSATNDKASATYAEELGIIAAIQHHRGAHVTIHTDSQNCISNSQRIRRVIQSNFTLVSNADVWRQFTRESLNTCIELHKVKAHAGIRGNEICDRLAGYAVIHGSPTSLWITTDALLDPIEDVTPTHDILIENTDVPILPADDDPPTNMEIQHAINSLRCHRAPGMDGITAEQLKTPLAFKEIATLIREIWVTGILPTAWKQTRLISIPKPQGGYRGIAILSTASKILTKTIQTRYCDTAINNEQFAFRCARNAMQAILAFKCHLHTRLMSQRPTFALLLDITKAYDSVGTNILDDVLKAYGVGPNARYLIAQLYMDEITVSAGNMQSDDKFTATCGVKQGCVLSPWIFSLYIDIAVTRMKRQHPYAIIYIYADDIVIIADTVIHINMISHTLSAELARIGLQINHDKSELLACDESDTRNSMIGYIQQLSKIGQNLNDPTAQHTSISRVCMSLHIPPGDTPLHCPIQDCPFVARNTLRTNVATLLLMHCKGQHPTHISQRAKISYSPGILPQHDVTDPRRLAATDRPSHTVTVNDHIIKGTSRVKYLGSWIDSSGSNLHDIDARINSANKAMGGLQRLWSSTDARIWIKAQMFKTIVLPVLLYGSGHWTLNTNELHRITTAFHKMARRASGLGGVEIEPGVWHTRSATEVRNVLHLSSMHDILREERLRLCIQIWGLQQNNLSHALKTCQRHTRRGPHHDCWAVRVQEDMVQVNLIVEDLENRTKWLMSSKAPKP